MDLCKYGVKLISRIREESEESTDRAAPLCDESGDVVAPLPVIPRMRRVGSLPLVPSAIEQRTKEDYSYRYIHTFSRLSIFSFSNIFYAPCEPECSEMDNSKLKKKVVIFRETC